MAPLIYSERTEAAQAEQLRAFLLVQEQSLSESATLNIVRALRLQKPARANLTARRLREGLAAHAIFISMGASYEAVAKMCGHRSWSHAKQRALQFVISRHKGAIPFSA